MERNLHKVWFINIAKLKSHCYRRFHYKSDSHTIARSSVHFTILTWPNVYMYQPSYKYGSLLSQTHLRYPLLAKTIITITPEDIDQCD